MNRSLILFALALPPSLASAQDVDPAREPKTAQLSLSPTSEPTPALRYVLLPPLADRKPGNAAPLYMKCMLRVAFNDPKAMAKLDEWASTPLDPESLDTVRRELSGLAGLLHDIDLAARRDQCDWELAIRDGKFYELLLPEVQNARTLARYVAVRTRLAIAERKYDEAVYSLQTGYALARHVAEGPTLINALVGIAIATMMNEQLTELIQQPDAPNMYWAITALPQPFISTLKGIEAERAVVALSFPALNDLNNKTRSAAEWAAALDELSHDLNYMNNDRETGAITHGMHASWRAAAALTGYTRAKEALISRGQSAEEVEAMPVAKVIAVYTMERYNEQRDDAIRWHYLPYWQARTGLQEAEARLSAQQEIIPLAKLLMPALQASLFAAARLDRQFGMLRTIEALRLYAKKNDGAWPSDLAAVKEVPLPLDATTGQPFRYRLDHSDALPTAILESPPPPGMQPLAGGVRYILKRSGS